MFALLYSALLVYVYFGTPQSRLVRYVTCVVFSTIIGVEYEPTCSPLSFLNGSFGSFTNVDDHPTREERRAAHEARLREHAALKLARRESHERRMQEQEATALARREAEHGSALFRELRAIAQSERVSLEAAAESHREAVAAILFSSENSRRAVFSNLGRDYDPKIVLLSSKGHPRLSQIASSHGSITETDDVVPVVKVTVPRGTTRALQSARAHLRQNFQTVSTPGDVKIKRVEKPTSPCGAKPKGGGKAANQRNLVKAAKSSPRSPGRGGGGGRGQRASAKAKPSTPPFNSQVNAVPSIPVVLPPDIVVRTPLEGGEEHHIRGEAAFSTPDVLPELSEGSRLTRKKAKPRQYNQIVDNEAISREIDLVFCPVPRPPRETTCEVKECGCGRPYRARRGFSWIASIFGLISPVCSSNFDIVSRDDRPVSHLFGFPVARSPPEFVVDEHARIISYADGFFSDYLASRCHGEERSHLAVEGEILGEVLPVEVGEWHDAKGDPLVKYSPQDVRRLSIGRVLGVKRVYTKQADFWGRRLRWWDKWSTIREKRAFKQLGFVGYHYAGVDFSDYQQVSRDVAGMRPSNKSIDAIRRRCFTLGFGHEALPRMVDQRLILQKFVDEELGCTTNLFSVSNLN